MADITFEEILEAVHKLSPEQKAILSQELGREKTKPTRESLIAELEMLRASGAFEHVESLANKYYNPATENMTHEQLLAELHEIATEWEQELDEFYGDED